MKFALNIARPRKNITMRSMPGGTAERGLGQRGGLSCGVRLREGRTSTTVCSLSVRYPAGRSCGRSALPKNPAGVSRASQKQTDAKGPVCRRFVIQSTGLVSRRCGGTKPAEAPVEGEQHALDIDVYIVAVPEVGLANVTVEVAVVAEIVEVGEAIVAADRHVGGD